MKKINFVDKIYCINLDESKERWKKMNKQFEKLEIDVERLSASKYDINDYNPVKKLPGQIGCLKSHERIIQNAKINNYENILILEDDVILHEKIVNILNDLYINNKMPDEWSEIFLTGGLINNNSKLIDCKYTNFKKMKNVVGTWAFILNKSIYDKLLSLYKTRKYNADDCHFRFIHNKDSYIIYPFLARIEMEESTITMNKANKKLHDITLSHFRK
jgi:GR25 family glycosyltransferase involved in LPS biosynthesis